MDATNSASPRIHTFATAPAYDEPYRFGRRPTVSAPFPFTERQFARLLIVRSRIQATDSADDQADLAR